MAKKAILIVSVTSFILTVLKLILGLVTGSILIVASSLDSFLDTLTSLFNYFIFLKSKKAPNRDFHYGFEKLEAFAGVFNALLIFVSGVYIVYESINKIISKNIISHVGESIFFMLFSICVLIGIVSFLSYVNKKERSLIIKADLLNYKMDLINNLVVISSLVIIKFTGLHVLDGIFGFLVGLYTCFNAIKVFKESGFILLDKAIDEALIKEIVDILDQDERINGYHELKTRAYLDKIFLECHLVFDRDISLLEAHDHADTIEEKIKALSDEFSWVILMHLDPYDDGPHTHNVTKFKKAY